VAGLRDYGQEVASYTRGLGRLFCTLRGYEPCHDPEAVISAIGYNPERDSENPADSVFCANGGGFSVKWDKVRSYMHVDSGLRLEKSPEPEPETTAGGRQAAYTGSLEQDKELQAVFERTYGKTAPQSFQPQRRPARTDLDERYDIRNQNFGPEYLLVDGYNIIFAWDDLKALAQENVAAARAALTDLLINYRGVRQCEVILVFDAYKVKGNPGSVEKAGGIYVVYTKEAETADAYIEKATYDLGKQHRVRVATSDGLEQMIILGHGALRVPARAFRQEMEQTQGQISAIISAHNQKGKETDKLKYTAKVTKQNGT
jgi:predicted RNA-binding protein with PIN domain